MIEMNRSMYLYMTKSMRKPTIDALPREIDVGGRYVMATSTTLKINRLTSYIKFNHYKLQSSRLMKRIVFFSWLFSLLGILSNAIFYEGIEAKSAKQTIVVEESSLLDTDSKLDSLTRSSYLPLARKMAFQRLDNQNYFYTELIRFSDQLNHYDKQLKVQLNSSLMMVLDIEFSMEFNKFSRHTFSADDPLSIQIS